MDQIPWSNRIYPWNARIVQHIQININSIDRINRMEDKNHMIISTNSEKTFARIQYPFNTKTLNKLGIKGTHLGYPNLDLQTMEKERSRMGLHGLNRIHIFFEMFKFLEGRRRSYICICSFHCTWYVPNKDLWGRNRL